MSTEPNNKTMILGGVRSGKSRLAERLAAGSGLAVTYVATATANDEAMRRRIAAHRKRRPEQWHLVEEPLRLAGVLKQHAASSQCVIVDCLTLWLTNLLTAHDPALFERQRCAFLAALPEAAGEVLLVSNETNMGVTPADDLSRRYCDEAGRLHQDLARLCDRLVLTVAGVPQVLKGPPL